MNEKSLAILAATSPKITFRTYREAAEKITSLETSLGLPASKPTWNIRRANSRIAELESMLAGGKAAPVSLPTGAAAVTPGNVATVEQFNAMPVADRETFSTNGGKLSVDSFNALAARVRGESNPLNNGTMSFAAFNRLGKNDQATMLRLGLKIAAK